MTHREHRIATAVLFVAFAAYGLEALTIPLFPGQELEPFKPRTMPVALAIAGLLLCGIRVLQLSRGEGTETGMRLDGLHWPPVLRLCIAMLAYGYLMIPLGFVLATTLFLVAGFLVLGERRKSILLILPIAFSVAFFIVMTQGLGLYLAPGTWLGF